MLPKRAVAFNINTLHAVPNAELQMFPFFKQCHSAFIPTPVTSSTRRSVYIRSVNLSMPGRPAAHVSAGGVKDPTNITRSAPIN